MSASLATLRTAGCLSRVDVALGDWIVRAFPEAAPGVALAAALAARAVMDGHSALALGQAQTWLDGLADADQAAATLPEITAWCDALRGSSAVHEHPTFEAGPAPLVLDPQRRVYLRRYFEYERQLARQLIARAAPAGRTPAPPPRRGGQGAVPPLEGGGLPPPRAGSGTPEQRTRAIPAVSTAESRASASESPTPASSVPAASPTAASPVPGPRFPDIDAEQRRAIDVALSHRFTLITGGPGTGKTHGVVRILAALAQQATSRNETLRIALAAPTGKAAARLLESVRAQQAQMQLPAATRAQIPDRAQTIHALIGVSPWRATPRFDRASPLSADVVVVDEGSMVDLPLMAKLVAAVADDARLIVLGDPDQLSAVEAGNVLPALVAAATVPPLAECHVTLTQSHRFTADSALGTFARAVACGDVEAALGASADGTDVTLAEGVRTSGLVEVAAAACHAILEASDAAAALHAARGFQVLTALRHGPQGCIALNRLIEARLKRELGLRADAMWWRGRMVLITANRPELGLYNGDAGVVWPDAHGSPRVWFEGADGLRALAPAALPPHEGAFALTVHKAQGSEFERVALVTGPDSAVLTRELLYTGATRARTGIALYTSSATLRAGIARRSLRMTGLADRLREVACGAVTEPRRAE